jgi:uncharacterized protein DUF5818
MAAGLLTKERPANLCGRRAMRKIVFTLSAAFLLSAGSLLVNLRAQDSTQTTTTRTTTRSRDAQSPDSQTTTVQTTTRQVATEQTYMGKIDKKDDQYILEDKAKRASYKLDNATKADRFKGDNVKVVGTLDSSTNMIHVQSIEKVKD